VVDLVLYTLNLGAFAIVVYFRPTPCWIVFPILTKTFLGILNLISFIVLVLQEGSGSQLIFSGALYFLQFFLLLVNLYILVKLRWKLLAEAQQLTLPLTAKQGP
jgi:hypothetical protein